MHLDLAHLTALGGWIYVILLAVVALDALLPVMPSESIVVTAAVLAARGDASVALVLATAIIGASAGDLASFRLGRRVRDRRVASGVTGDLTGRAGRAVRWAEHQLDAHGPGTLVISRFVPGGRTAATFTAGFVGMRTRVFGASAATGAVLWSTQAVAIGFAGGHVFEDDLVLGIGLGVLSGTLVGVAIEVVRHRLADRPTGSDLGPACLARP